MLSSNIYQKTKLVGSSWLPASSPPLRSSPHTHASTHKCCFLLSHGLALLCWKGTIHIHAHPTAAATAPDHSESRNGQGGHQTLLCGQHCLWQGHSCVQHRAPKCRHAAFSVSEVTSCFEFLQPPNSPLRNKGGEQDRCNPEYIVGK